jgi:hypothetical protein
MRVKIFERRWRVSWLTFLILALPFWTLAALALVSGELLFLKGRVGGGTRSILKSDNPDGFLFFLCGYILFAVVASFFSVYRFRRGSWFNPI